MVTSVRSTAKAQHTRGFNHCSTSSSSTHLDKVGLGLQEGESEGDYRVRVSHLPKSISLTAARREAAVRGGRSNGRSRGQAAPSSHPSAPQRAPLPCHRPVADGLHPLACCHLRQLRRRAWWGWRWGWRRGSRRRSRSPPAGAASAAPEACRAPRAGSPRGRTGPPSGRAWPSSA
eukprot:scaffold138372_cov90-Phaeocystis_antarctica.AAC.1